MRDARAHPRYANNGFAVKIRTSHSTQARAAGDRSRPCAYTTDSGTGGARVHINALRKTLGCGQSGVRYVENVTGRGYLFIAPVIRREETRMRQPGLTVPLTRMIGREATRKAPQPPRIGPRTSRVDTIVGKQWHAAAPRRRRSP